MNACGMDPAREAEAIEQLAAERSYCEPVPEQIAEIMAAAEYEYGLATGTLASISRRTKRRPEATARKLALWIARYETAYSTVELGRYFGAVDHSSVISCCRRVDEDEQLRKAADRIAARAGLRRAA